MGIKGRRDIPWTPEEDAFVDECQALGISQAAIGEAFLARFGRPRNKKQIQSRLQTRKGLNREWCRKKRAEKAARQNAGTSSQAKASCTATKKRTEVTEPYAEIQDYVPHPARGPQETPHYIPEGHELKGVSRLKDADGNIIQEWDKTHIAGADQPPVPVPPSFLIDRTSTMQRGDGSTAVQWTSYKQGAVERWESIKAAIEDHCAQYVRPARPVEAPAVADADRITLYPIGDPHVGMLAWSEEVGKNFDLKIAEAELVECFRQLVARSPATEEAIVANLGDFWHAQDSQQRTPQNGNRLDVDGRFGKVARVGLRIIRTVVDLLLTKHRRVRVRNMRGNHDPDSALWIVEFLRAVYENEPRVVVEDGFAAYQFDTFGKVLIGWAHGDGCKMEALGEIMATDVPELWGASEFREWHVGHIHHKRTLELRGCVVQSHRTLAAGDEWHRRSGYRSGRSLKAVVYHRTWGLDSEVTVGVERVRAALEAS